MEAGAFARAPGTGGATLLNDDIGQALTQVRAILSAERFKRDRQTGLSAFVRKLQGEL